MTRTGSSPRLCAHSPEPFIEIHPADAEAAKLVDGGFAKITTRYGSAILKVAFTAGQRRGSIFAPIHWSDATAAHARVGDMVAAANDPFSGQPELKATPARVEPVEFAYRGFALTRRRIALPSGTWFARVGCCRRRRTPVRHERAARSLARSCRRLMPEDAELAEYIDRPRGLVRIAAFRSGRLDGCIFVGPAHAPPQWERGALAV